MGFVASDELNPQKARILLMLALLKPRTTTELQQLFKATDLYASSRAALCDPKN